MLRTSTVSRIPLRAIAWLPVPAIMLLAACASIPPPNATMSRAQASIQAAEKAGAADADPVDLDFARGKYAQAQTAMTARKYGLASNLAEESLADSRLARTKARLATMRTRIQAQTRENARLRKQLLEQPAAAAAPSQAPAAPAAHELPETVLPMPSVPSSAPAPASSSPVATANDPQQVLEDPS